MTGTAGSQGTPWAALLRGINVGGHNILPMADLRAAAAAAGLQDPRSYIQSGNLTFRAAGPAPRIAEALQEAIETAHGLHPRIIVLSGAELRAALQAAPFDAADPARLLAYFAKGPLSALPEGAQELAANGEALALAGGALWLHAPAGIGRSKLAARLEALAGQPLTARNLRTLQKLEQLLPDA